MWGFKIRFKETSCSLLLYMKVALKRAACQFACKRFTGNSLAIELVPHSAIHKTSCRCCS